MLTPSHYRRHRARCTALRSMRSAALALSIVSLPKLIAFIETGAFTRDSLKARAQALAVAALMVLFNYVQRLRETDRHRAGRRRGRHHANPRKETEP